MKRNGILVAGFAMINDCGLNAVRAEKFEAFVQASARKRKQGGVEVCARDDARLIVASTCASLARDRTRGFETRPSA